MGEVPPPAAKDGSGEKHESFKVFARMRPAREQSDHMKVVTRFEKSQIIHCRNLEFMLDWIWDIHDTQEMVYNRGVRERVSQVLNGFNATVLMYGQTGSGKTHTMFGPDEVVNPHTYEHSDPALHGIVPRACAQLFDAMADASEGTTFVVHVSYVECYNGHLRDVLATGKRDEVVARETAQGLQLEGLSHTLVSSPSEVMHAIMRGNERRVVAAMAMNARSSRGHAVITLHVREVRGEGSERAGKLALVDLAGMESSKKSYAMEGPSKAHERQEEVKHINQSLWALGSVIERLSALGGKPGHVPYRDSKLTRLLQSSLTGSSKCAFIATLRGEEENVDESIGTLRFAQRAKAIRVSVKGNNQVMNREALQNALHKAQEELHRAHQTIEQMEADMANAAANAEAKAAAAAAAAAQAQAHAESLARTNSLSSSPSSPRRNGGSGEDEGADSAEVQRRMAEYEERLSSMMSELTAERQALARTEHQNVLNSSMLEKKTSEVERLAHQMEELTASIKEMEEAIVQRDVLLQDKEEELLAAKAVMATASPVRASVRGSHVARHVSRRQRQGIGGAAGDFTYGSDGANGGGGGHRLGMLRESSGADAYAFDAADMLSLDAASQSVSSSDSREARYHRFVELATARKLALAARGFEVENVFVDQLFDDIERGEVPEDKWLEFLKLEFPAPDHSDLAKDDADDREVARVGEEEDSAELSAEGGANGKGRSSAARARWNRLKRANSTVSHFSTVIDERRRKREAGGLPMPVARSIKLFPDAPPPDHDGGVSPGEVDEMASSLMEDAERRRRELDELRAQKAAARGGLVKRLADRVSDWSSSVETQRLLMALLALVLLCVVRFRRLRAEDPLALLIDDLTLGVVPSGAGRADDAPGLVNAGDEDDLAVSRVCRWDWGVPGCVERTSGLPSGPLLAEGVVCALRPTVGKLMRCRPVAAAATGGGALRGGCPAHCQPAACSDAAASVLYRVAKGLRADCAMDGSCPGDVEAKSAGAQASLTLGRP